MKTRIRIALLIGAACVVSFLFARGYLANRTLKGALRENVEEALSLAGQKYKEGDYAQARSLYERTLFSQPDPRKAQEIKQRIETINISMLFSPKPDGQSTLYTVQKGDSLARIAQEHHTTVALIKRSNKLTSDMLRVGEKLKLTTLRFSIVVDKSSNRLFLKAGEQVVKTYTVATGKNNCTPAGSFKIVNKLYHPTWFKAGAVVSPESPDNILGSRWMGIDVPGYGIHGTTQPQAIGQQVTAGCVRMRNEDVEELFDIVPEGTAVTIVD